MSEPVFLTLDEVLKLHTRSLAEHGGSEGVRDQGLVESALASAKNTFYYGQGDLFDVAASYAFHLAESQAFLVATKGPPSRQPWFFLRSMVLTRNRQNGNCIWR